MTRPNFTLTVVTSADGYIARRPGESPATWASVEEQALFFRDVDAADWAVMGRGTHEAAERPDRHRIVFSTGTAGWRRPTQLWLDPEGLTPDDLARRVADVRPMRTALILGGTRVHDWFMDRGAVDRVHLTVEPVTFGDGLPLLTGATGPAEDVLAARGFRIERDERLNDAGTRYLVLVPGGADERAD